ncbi:MAG: FG-GAP-like repeat-containing protein, partial [Schlesneria sp.]
MHTRSWIPASVEYGLVAIGVCLVLVGGVICVQPECFPTADQLLVKKLLAAIELRRSDAFGLAQEYLKRPESGPFGIALAADAAAVNFENNAAVELYRRLPKDGGKWEFLAEMGLARRCEVTGRLTDEERHLRRALELSPHHVEASSRLGHILQVAGRNWEGISPFFDQIRRGKCRGDELLAFAVPERFFRSDERFEELGLAANPPEILIKLAVARRVIYENRQAEAEKLLREVIDEMPELGEAQGRLGRIIYDRGDAEEFLQWRGQLPSEAQNHPEVWFVQGLQARRLGLIEGATRCFLETLCLSPNHLAANVQIAGCLDQLKQSAMAKEFVHRAEKLANVESLLNLLRNDVDPEMIKRVITSFGELGRFWEAAGWTYLLTHLPGVSNAQTHQDLKYWLRKAQQDSNQVSMPFNLAAKLRKSDFREPRWSSSFGSGRSLNRREGNEQSGINDEIPWSFQEEAERVGLSFNYYEGTTEETRLQHIFNVVGGGVAAVDYDLDGLCDVYLAQANNWRDPTPQPKYTDRLFRNVDGRFVDVTTLAGTDDLSFSHGVTVGDFDQDGFSDLYIGNLGPNRLYRNNGDGTFSDVTTASNVAGNEWTTSSVFADFSGDGLPDLYVANYSVMEETAKKECKDKSGEQMACTPDMLTAEFHRLYLNEGDGRFRDITLESGMRIPNGRGLGLVAWDFGGDGHLGLFVANDTSPNF